MSITINGQTSQPQNSHGTAATKSTCSTTATPTRTANTGYMLSKNGEAGYKVLPVSELQRVWDQSCPLRFINNWALDKNYVPQCYEKPVTIEAR